LKRSASVAARAWNRARDPSVAMLFTTAASLLLRLGSNLVLAHLLLPRAFGLVGITSLIATALAMLSDTGVWIAIVRKGDVLDRKWLDQMWTLQAVRGLALSLIAFALGPLVAHAYHEPQLGLLLPVANIWLLILGLESLHPFVQQKDLRPGPRLKLQFVTQIVGSAVSIIGASLYPSPWALVAGLLAGAASSTIMSHVWAREALPRPCLTLPFLKEQWRLAAWLTVSTGLGFFGGQIDRLLFPAWFGTNTFGVYNIALTFALALLGFGMGWADSIFMPAIAKLNQTKSEAAELQLRSLTRTVVLYAAIASALVGGVGAPFFQALYPKQFAAAAVFVQILAVTGYATFLTYLHRRTFLYQGLTRLEASIEGARLLLFLGGLGLAVLMRHRPTAIQYVELYATVQIVVYLALMLVGRIKKLVHYRDDLPGHIALIVGMTAMAMLSAMLKGRFGPVVSLLICGIAAFFICLLAAMRLGLPTLPSSPKSGARVQQRPMIAYPSEPQDLG
jgi:O-antigen/teichoic acid export membrane protein